MINKERSQHRLTCEYRTLSTYFDPAQQTLWCTINNNFFNLAFLEDVRNLQDNIVRNYDHKPGLSPKYLVWQSSNPKIFSLGLDLSYLLPLIIKQDVQALKSYIHSCLDVLYINSLSLDLPIITMVVLCGKALSGGLEAAFSNNFIIAEENTRCGFPEIKYNLLPPLVSARQMIKNAPHSNILHLLYSGKICSAAQFKEIGLIDVVVPNGEGQAFAQKYIKDLQKKFNAVYAMYAISRKNLYTARQEIEDYAEVWIQSALNLKLEQIEQLKKIAKMQSKISK